MRSLTSSRPKGRTVSAILVAGALVVSAGVGGATAGALITGKDIKDKSITGRTALCVSGLAGPRPGMDHWPRFPAPNRDPLMMFSAGSEVLL